MIKVDHDADVLPSAEDTRRFSVYREEQTPPRPRLSRPTSETAYLLSILAYKGKKRKS
jgi:hypothetical protein